MRLRGELVIGALAGLAGLIAIAAQAVGQSAPSAGTTSNPLAQVGTHMSAGGAAPTISSGCGTGATIAGSDLAGRVQLGTATSQPCTITFAAPYIQRPACVVEGDNFTASHTVSATAINVTALVDSAAVKFICIAQAGG